MNKKNKILNFILMSCLLCLIALSNSSDNRGNIKDNDNVGNHANMPGVRSPNRNIH